MGQLSLLSLLKKQHQEQKFQELDQQQLEQESNEKIQIKLLDFINLHQNLSIKDVYEILPSKLGIGSQSVVKIGLHKVLGITRAIKIIDKSTVLIGDISTVLHEAEILKQLV
ncbi:unnamed protein product [Paramecium sonneborni]|uniref:Uncharacterized protein n=1 Tax=Paramecium sonneborni TaxID=65129 RepID=A0A8S1Q8Y5_9CILI|nr:unnamed protein product [Paramecium sonneborni]